MPIIPESPVPFTSVNLTDTFWSPRQVVNRQTTIPHIYNQCDKTGRLAAWNLDWKEGDPCKPHIFWDSDVMKWVEAASYSLALRYDTCLDEQLDHLIGKVARAQQPDGYVNSHFIAIEPEKRWTNLRDWHELYCAGHLIEAAVAHHTSTGKTSLLDVARRYADHIETQFGRDAGKKRGYPGHPEIELALIKLYRLTNESRYLRLAAYFVDERGKQPHYYDIEARERGQDPAAYYFGNDYTYLQAHQPVREQTEVVGHAVRAMYLYSAMADLAGETGDALLLSVCQNLFRQLTSKRLYVTGGIGSSAKNEGFTRDYDLPVDAYAETCAAIGLSFWSHRMLLLTGEGHYADVLERVLYNGFASSVSLAGDRFFYANPLSSQGDTHRATWYDCACCPPNIARLMESIGGYFYSTDATGIQVNLYGANEAFLEVNSQEIMVCQKTDYPWNGAVKIGIYPQVETRMNIRLRIPSWCKKYSLFVNGEHLPHTIRSGYLQIERVWKSADQVFLSMSMPVRNLFAHPNVTELSGRVALTRGPLIYCLEGVDHTKTLDHIAVPVNASSWQANYNPEFLGGVSVLQGQGSVIETSGWEDELYRPSSPKTKPTKLVAVPYCVWDNRSAGEMRVWPRTDKI